MPTTNADTPVQGTSLEEAARQMEALLDPLEDTENVDPSPAADAAPADTPVPDESVAKAKAESEETPPPEEAEADEAKATDAAEEAPVTDEKDRLVTVKVDGKSEAIPLEEVTKGYLRQADYSRKLDVLTTERHKLESELKAVVEERQTYAIMLGHLRNQLQTNGEEEPDWDKVYAEDPMGYARRRDQWRDRQDKIAAAQFELQRVEGLQRQQHEENLKQIVAKGRAHMMEKMPAWKDPKVWEEDRQATVKYAMDNGYSAEEIEKTYDPRMVIFAHKARLWDEAHAQELKPVPKKGPKVAAPGAVQAFGDTSRLNAAQQRLARTGSLNDAAKVFEQII